MLDKVGEYLDPEKATAAVFRSLTDVCQVERDGTLDGEDVVPGVTCPLSGLLT